MACEIFATMRDDPTPAFMHATLNDVLRVIVPAVVAWLETIGPVYDEA
jgi:hypothetical protein